MLLTIYGTEWPILCWSAVKKLLTHSHSGFPALNWKSPIHRWVSVRRDFLYFLFVEQDIDSCRYRRRLAQNLWQRRVPHWTVQSLFRHCWLSLLWRQFSRSTLWTSRFFRFWLLTGLCKPLAAAFWRSASLTELVCNSDAECRTCQRQHSTRRRVDVHHTLCCLAEW